MKQALLLLGVVFFICSCSTNKKASKNGPDYVIERGVEYDVEMFNAEFESWYAIQHSSAEIRQQTYYENWNRQYVAAWNIKCASPPKN